MLPDAVLASVVASVDDLPQPPTLPHNDGSDSDSVSGSGDGASPPGVVDHVLSTNVFVPSGTDCSLNATPSALSVSGIRVHQAATWLAVAKMCLLHHFGVEFWKDTNLRRWYWVRDFCHGGARQQCHAYREPHHRSTRRVTFTPEPRGTVEVCTIPLHQRRWQSS